MNENSYQKLAELIDRAPRLLGPGGLFGGLNQEHGLMVDFVKFVRGLKIGNNMSPETVNIRSFVAYLGDRKNAEEVGRKLYDMRRNGEIVDDPHVKAKNTLLNLAETLIDLGVGEKPENVGRDYEGVLRRAVAQSRSESAVGGRAEARASGASTYKQKGPGNVQNFSKNQPKEISKGERDEASPETPLSTMGESLTDDISIARVEEAQAGALAIGRAGVSRSETEAHSEKIGKAKQGGAAPAPESTTLQEPTSALEGNLASPEAAEISGDTSFRDSELLRQLTVPIIGEVAGQAVGRTTGQETSRLAGQATGEALAGTKLAPGGERRHIAQLPGGGRMLRKGPKKQGQTQEQGQGRGTGESKQDHGRQTGPGRNPAQNFANSQAAQPQKSRVGRRVAGGAGIAGSLALMKGMYGGAAASAASFGILQKILDFLT